MNRVWYFIQSGGCLTTSCHNRAQVSGHNTMEKRSCYLLIFLLHLSKAALPVVMAVAGEDAELPCNYPAPQKDDRVLVIFWYKDQNVTAVYTVDARAELLHNAPHIPFGQLGTRARFEAFSVPPVLKILNVSERDGGIYFCRVDYVWARTFISNFILKVVVPPKRLVIFDDTGGKVTDVAGPYNEGSDLRLTCEAYGGTTPLSVTWWRGETLLDDTCTELPGGVVRNILKVNTLHRDDLMADFSCQASNNISSPLVVSIKTDMNLKPTTVNIITEHWAYLAYRKVEVVCTTSGSRPPSRITWWKEGIQLRNTTEEVQPRNFSGEMSDNNLETKGILSFWPSPEDNGKLITCRAGNPQLPGGEIETSRPLNVSYPPRVSLSLKTYTTDGKHLEGSDVKFTCKVSSNPRASLIEWLFEGHPLPPSMKAGLVPDMQSLVLKKANSLHIGRYRCRALNVLGTGQSEEVLLKFHHSPVCNKGQKIAHGVKVGSMVKVECSVEADPTNVTFEWSFRNPAGQRRNLTFISQGLRSVVTYIPRGEQDYGTLYCSARNAVGEQQTPCIFTVIPAGPPDPVSNCIVTNSTSDSLQVACTKGYDGGLQQRFILEIYTAATKQMQKTVTGHAEPIFYAKGLASRTIYNLIVYAENAQGRSRSTSFSAETLEAEASIEDCLAEASSTGMKTVAVVVSGSLLAVLLFAGLVEVLNRRVLNRGDKSAYSENDSASTSKDDVNKDSPSEPNIPEENKKNVYLVHQEMWYEKDIHQRSPSKADYYGTDQKIY